MKPKLLLTGASGFIGSKIFDELKDDFEITGISSSSGNTEFKSLNLLDAGMCEAFFCDQKFDVIIHAAAIAHGKNNVNNMSVEEANILMTKNIFNPLDVSKSKVVFLSSVSVYSFKNKNNKEYISIKNKPVPVSPYGKSKLVCEEILQNINAEALHILRLAPVFSENNLKDLGKRVFLPVLKIPFFTKQERFYSLCHLDQIIAKVKELVHEKESSLLIVKDARDYSQQDLLAFFNIDKPKVTVNRNFLKPVFLLLEIFPLKKINNIKEMFHKLFFSTKYTND
ncbi:NAD-dependent epimerase/dehydratase family protein [Chryseobacterium indologenes]|uniref:UDP-glucose 4-epimerase n=1 Tax=Chryseobacterium indologenes TaxID=253 RepID=A0A0N0ZSW5_CHRID|nr:NAD-dependent epimerase/dehydratase family protein [Chryseobacterium indologenes]KPE49838.1 hypothetical protein AOB46_17915 [Chryseobacterium indologenes]